MAESFPWPFPPQVAPPGIIIPPAGSEVLPDTPVHLPPFIALKSFSYNNYLNYSSDSDSQTRGFLRFNGGNVFSPLAKFEVVTANVGTGLVHIRCFHNKKFLRRTNQGGVYLTPAADDPEEDQSKWSCTLFEPRGLQLGDVEVVRLLHVHGRQYATAWNTGGRIYCGLSEEKSAEQILFEYTDLETLVILPRHVALKGHTGRYLTLMSGAKVMFTSTDKGVSESWFEAYTDSHGRVQIKSYHDGSYLFNSNDRIWSDPRVDATHPSTLFWPVKVDGNTVALKSNNKFCGQINEANGTDTSLCAFYTSIASNSRFMLEELVLSRRIYNTDFDLSNAIIYGETPVTMATANASNNTTADNTVVFRFAYTQSQSNTWNTSHSWMVGIQVQISANIPFGLGGIQNTYSAQYNGSYEWGETITTETTLETTYTATVPANTSISVSLVGTKGYCDVPFSYYQRDVLYNGKTAVYKKDDGLYTGINSYNFRYDVTTLREQESRADLPTKEQRLPDPSIDPSKQQSLPIPVPSGSTIRVNNKVTSTTTLEELSSLKLEDTTKESKSQTPCSHETWLD